MNEPDYLYVDNAAGVDRLRRQLERSDAVALDTEANSLYNYYERVCLLQISTRKHHFVVDPLAPVDLEGALGDLAGKDLILHGADFDLRLMRSTFGFRPQGDVFDTMLAAQLLGHERIGYAALVEQFAGVALSKAGQKSNWARRPLLDSQLQYAADDTRYLATVARELRSGLKKLGRIEWHREWCQRTVQATQVDPIRDTENAWRMKGLGGLDRKELAMLRAIWHWRDREARDTDRPPFKVLGNDALIRLAVWATQNPRAPLNEGPTLPRNLDGKRIAALKESIREARSLPKSEWPAIRRNSGRPHGGNGDYREQTDALRRECAKIAHELQISPSVLAPKAMLAAIARNDAREPLQIRECSPMMEWQIDLLGGVIRETLEKFREAKG